MAIKTASGSDLRNSLSSGLVLLNTTTFSGVASQSFNDVFSATYDNYRVISKIVTTGTAQINLRTRVGGSDNSASNYFYSGTQTKANTATLTSFRGASQTSLGLGDMDAATDLHFVFDIWSPFLTNYTQVNSQYVARQNDAKAFWVLGHIDVTTSYSGFTIFPNTGNITGSISVYGYNK